MHVHAYDPSEHLCSNCDAPLHGEPSDIPAYCCSVCEEMALNGDTLEDASSWLDWGL